MKKIVVVVPNGGGGAEKISIIYAKIFKKHGYDVKIVLIDKKGGSGKIVQYLPSNIPVTKIQCRHGYGAIWSLYKVIKAEKPDYAFSSLTVLAVGLILCSMWMPTVRVITRQCFTPGKESFFVEHLISLFFRKAYINIAQTEEMRQLMICKYHLNPSKVITINNPLDEEDIYRKIANIKVSEEKHYRYVAIGRIHPSKDVLTILRALAIVKKYDEQASLLIIGAVADNDYMAMLQREVIDLNIEDCVTFMDYTDNPYKYLLCCECFVLASLTEGLPNVLNEAMFLSRPVVATCSIPYISQVICDGVNGYKIETLGDYQTLAEKMLLAVKLKNINNPNLNKSIESKIISLIN